MQLKEDEKIEDLQYKGLQIIQNKKWFCFGMDSVLISNFVKTKKHNVNVIDLGAGTGVISILLSAKIDVDHITCIEKQSEMCDIIERNIQLNNLNNKLNVINCDVLEITKEFQKTEIPQYDIVVTNPPYKKKNTGLDNENQQKHISKVESSASLEDFISQSKNLLKDKGQFFIVHRPERLVDILSLMRKYKIEPKRMKLVYSKKDSNKDAKLVLIEGVKNGNPFLKVEKNLYIYNQDGTYTNQIKKIYT